jgi:hypothetical protein
MALGQGRIVDDTMMCNSICGYASNKRKGLKERRGPTARVTRQDYIPASGYRPIGAKALGVLKNGNSDSDWKRQCA